MNIIFYYNNFYHLKLTFSHSIYVMFIILQIPKHTLIYGNYKQNMQLHYFFIYICAINYFDSVLGHMMTNEKTTSEEKPVENHWPTLCKIGHDK